MTTFFASSLGVLLQFIAASSRFTQLFNLLVLISLFVASYISNSSLFLPKGEKMIVYLFEEACNYILNEVKS